MILNSIRRELFKSYGLLKHAESAAEQVVRERLGQLHDELISVEAGYVTISLPALRELRALAGSASAATLKHVDEMLAFTEKAAATLQAQRDKQHAATLDAAAKAALVVPAAPPAEVPLAAAPETPSPDSVPPASPAAA